MFNFLMPVTRNKVLVGTVAAMLGATCYGSSQFLVRQIVTTHDIPPLIIATYALLFGLIVLTILSQNTIKQDRRAPMRGFIFMALAGLTASVGAGFNYSALGIAPVVIVAPVSAATVVAARHPSARPGHSFNSAIGTSMRNDMQVSTPYRFAAPMFSP